MKNYPLKMFMKINAIITSKYMDLKVRPYLKDLKSKKNASTKKIRVGFIVQMAEIWDKEVGVYEEMNARENFETFMLVVPPYDFETKNQTLSYENNFFLKRYAEAIRVFDKKNQLIDIDSFNLDYVFYQRPYNNYLPLELRSSELVKKTKCCYIPYGFSGADVFNEGNSNSDFFRNIYFAFMESDYMQKVLARKYKKNIKRGYQHFEYRGYPALEPYFAMPPATNEFHQILWTPRWSYDEKIGGSHFIEYKDTFVELKKENEVELVFRPHPLMVEELMSKNLMTHDEITSYIKMLHRLNIQYDVGTPIETAIKDADVLITDFSSIIIMFFLTGKPIIYCESQLKFNETYAKIKECMYIAKKSEDIKKYVAMLKQGNDPLREKRRNLIQREFMQCQGSVNNIVERIIKDFYKT